MVKDAEAKESTYKGAYKYSYIRGVTRKNEYEENEKRINELELRKGDLARSSSMDLLEMDAVQATRLSELKGRLKALRRQRSVLQARLQAMSEDMELDSTSIAQDYSDLAEFFPEADIKHIAEIDAFHRKIRSVLNSEYKEKTTIQHIIRNEKYCGDCLFQKAFIANPITHRQVRNTGELPKYLVEDCLPAIVDKDTWKLAQEVAARHTPHKQAPNQRYPFTGKLICGVCGKPYYYYHYTTTNKQSQWFIAV